MRNLKKWSIALWITLPISALAQTYGKTQMLITGALRIQDDAHATCYELIPAWGCRAHYNAVFLTLTDRDRMRVVRLDTCEESFSSWTLTPAHPLIMESSATDSPQRFSANSETLKYRADFSSRAECLANYDYLASASVQHPLSIEVDAPSGQTATFRLQK